MAISIVSLAWEQSQLTKDFLNRLKKYTDIEHQLVFTDNGSEEPISDIVKSIYPDAKLIRYDKNIGCPATRNWSMKEATGDLVFWLDNDTMVGEGWYKPFLKEFEKNNSLALVGIDGRRVRKPFSIDNPWVFPDTYSPNPYCDWFVGYAMAFKKDYYKPIPDWQLMVNMDDVDLGMGIKANGGYAKALAVQPNLKHLGSQTAYGVRPGSTKEREVLEKWWKYWEPQSQRLEEYR